MWLWLSRSACSSRSSTVRLALARSPRAAVPGLTALCADLQSREGARLRPVLVLNLDVKDNASEAAVAAPLALGLCSALAAYGDDWAAAVDGLLAQFEAQHQRRPLYRICFY